jgi:hypothetical protein
MASKDGTVGVIIKTMHYNASPVTIDEQRQIASEYPDTDIP